MFLKMQFKRKMLSTNSVAPEHVFSLESIKQRGHMFDNSEGETPHQLQVT